MSVRLDGFDELVKFLTDAPDEIRAEAFGILKEETEGAAVEIAQSYPQKTGTLAKRVKTTYPAESVLIGIVQSAAPHSHLYEFGTKQRQTKTGANRGVMPAKKTTPDIAQKRRARMYRRMKDMLTRRGFEVSEG